MNRKNINFDNKKIKKSDFSKNKKAFQADNIDVNKILVSKKEPYDTKNALKYFIEYNDNDVIRPLFLRLPLVMLKNLMKIQKCLLGLIMINNF